VQPRSEELSQQRIRRLNVIPPFFHRPSAEIAMLNPFANGNRQVLMMRDQPIPPRAFVEESALHRSHAIGKHR
jgi:hypothetical protein